MKTVKTAVGIFGAIFIGLCLYLDYLRRSDPDYKKNIKERRKANNQEIVREKSEPEMTNESMCQFIYNQILEGEKLISDGEIEEGVEHFCNAVQICPQPNKFLETLQGLLPPVLFHALSERLHEHHNKEVEVECTEEQIEA